MSIAGGPDIVENGLVLHLDAADLNSYPGSGTLWTDLSGNGYNGTLTNGPTFSSSNRGSIVFDGTNDYITFSATTQSLGLTSSLGATISCWLKLTLLTRWTGVLTFWKTTVGDCDFGWDIQSNNNLRIWKSNTVNSVSLLPYNNIWVYYSLVSNSSGTIFYVNQNQLATTSQTGNVPFISGRTLIFGDHWDNPMQGSSTSLQIYNRALTASEIQQNYNATKGRYGL